MKVKKVLVFGKILYIEKEKADLIEDMILKIESMAKLLDYEVSSFENYSNGLEMVYIQNEWTLFYIMFEHENYVLNGLYIEVHPKPHGVIRRVSALNGKLELVLDQLLEEL